MDSNFNSNPNLPDNIQLLFDIFKRSKISLNDYYETCTYISVETCNNQNVIDKMPFWLFNNYLIYLKKILTKKNESDGGGNSEMNPQKQYSNMMGQSKNMYKNFASQQNISGYKNKFK